MEGIRSKQ